MAGLLLTGFGAFPGMKRNPSATIARYIGRHPGRAGESLRTAVLPVDIERCRVLLPELIEEACPDAVLLCGVARPGPSVAVERAALNAAHADIPDAGGRRLVHEPVLPGGPAAYLSAINCSGIVSALVKEGLSAHVSYHAGTYLCNAAFFIACHEMARLAGAARAVFLHVPAPAAGGSSLPYAVSRRTVAAAARHLAGVL